MILGARVTASDHLDKGIKLKVIKFRNYLKKKVLTTFVFHLEDQAKQIKYKKELNFFTKKLKKKLVI